MIGKVLIDDKLGTVVDVLSEVENHPYLGLDGKQRRWVVSTFEKQVGQTLPPVHCQVNDSQILKWLIGPIEPEQVPRERKYDWDQILNGEIWSLVAGKDFDCKVETFKALAKKQAAKRGQKLNIKLEGDQVVVQGVLDAQS